MQPISSVGTAVYSSVPKSLQYPKNSRYVHRVADTQYIVWTFEVASPVETPPANQAAIALLRSWAEEGDEQEQRDTWEYLKEALDEDRLSDRKLFP